MHTVFDVFVVTPILPSRSYSLLEKALFRWISWRAPLIIVVLWLLQIEQRNQELGVPPSHSRSSDYSDGLAKTP